MNAKHMQFPLYFVLLAAVGALVAVGAGCAPSDTSVAVPPTAANGEAVLSYADRVQPIMPPVDRDPAPTPTPAAEPVSKSEGAGSGEASGAREDGFPGVLPAARISGKQVRMQTTKGEIVFELFDKEAPKAVSNYVALTERGYYNGLSFHRVVPGFVIQGGDPEGTGMGGPGYKFEDEPVTREYDAGIVAMANAGPDTNGSQFFIMLEDNPTLPKAYTIFGRVTKGLDIVRKIAVGDKMTTVTVETKK